MSTTAISKAVFQEVDGTMIVPLTFIKEWAFPAHKHTLFSLSHTCFHTRSVLYLLTFSICSHSSASSLPFTLLHILLLHLFSQSQTNKKLSSSLFSFSIVSLHLTISSSSLSLSLSLYSILTASQSLSSPSLSKQNYTILSLFFMHICLAGL